MTIRIGSLFSGIGGLELGLERSTNGHVTWQVEQDEWCRGVLARHWPNAIRYDDVRTVGAANLSPVEVICGGFPCQDISTAGRGAGLAGERSGLWREYARIVRELRPRVVVVENVAALLARGLGDVLGDLAALGYDATWDCIPAAAVGAPHRRDRLFIVAYARGDALRQQSERVVGRGGAAITREACASLAHAYCERGNGRGALTKEDGRRESADGGERFAPVADADDARSQGHWRPVDLAYQAGRQDARRHGSTRGARNDRRHRSAESRMGRATHGFPAGLERVRAAGYRWPAGPGQAQAAWEAPRTARGVSDRARRLKALGNAVVPQVAEVIGHVVAQLLAEEA